MTSSEQYVSVEYDQDNMKLFWNMMAERHRIYKARQSGQKPPWSNDLILCSFKFTNVFRELDTGTRFVTDYLIGRCKTLKEYIFTVMVYRMFNKIESVHWVLENYKDFYKNFCQKIFEFKIRKFCIVNPDENVFTNAFIVSGFSHLNKEWDKISRVCFLIGKLHYILEHYPDDMNFSNMQDAYKWIITQDGYGPFLGYQVAVDLSYHPDINFGEDDFVICGPGCKRGLIRLFGEDGCNEHGYEFLNEFLRDNQYEFCKDYGIDLNELLDDREYPYITLMSIENLLCEFSKYMKVHNGEGRPRNKHNFNESYKRIGTNNYSTWLCKNNKPFNVYSKINMKQTEWSNQ